MINAVSESLKAALFIAEERKNPFHVGRLIVFCSSGRCRRPIRRSPRSHTLSAALTSAVLPAVSLRLRRGRRADHILTYLCAELSFLIPFILSEIKMIVFRLNDLYSIVELKFRENYLRQNIRRTRVIKQFDSAVCKGYLDNNLRTLDSRLVFIKKSS